eukprot:CAMPEP_0119006540 /NCGR_PEP_ID=MMETSP1176-20130426/2346_1 /TAXON_ID=265551 /ORGANISM="Synedropsis recta cf, Strain CCMP1620" /LENGTH=1101 /DNA_ID=CAMNT_0006958457 /DNA_START=62 /DNA_END=3368 /DNA_ORIENTATION=-
MAFFLRRRDLLAVMALVGLVFYSDIRSLLVVSKNGSGRSLLVTELADDYVERAGIVKDYSQTEIEATAPHLQVFHPRLLVWSDDDTGGESGFRVYNLDHTKGHGQNSVACGRCGKTIPLMVNALLENYPTRFQPGQPVFQMLWSDADSFQSACVNSGTCDVDQFAPLPLFGSVPKDPTVLPTVKSMPNWFYINCLYNWKFNVDDYEGGADCWQEHVDNNAQWNDLQSTVIYRGSDFTFLPTYDELSFFNPATMANFPDQAQFGGRGIGGEDDGLSRISPEAIVMKLFHHWNSLNPRWRAIALSAQAELLASSDNSTEWLDAKFVGPMRRETHDKFESFGVQVAAEPLDPMQMSRYKYQLDLGGGGGTSWRGTVSKLRMPGVLLHHETPTMDWFYPNMKPFQHYIPINLDLSDLKAKYEWAEASPDRAQQIAEEGQKLAQNLFTNEYMTELYQDLFVDYMGKVVHSFQPSNATWAQARQRYADKGFALTEVAYCRSTRCFTNVRDDVYRSFPHVVEEAAAAPSLLQQQTTSKATIVAGAEDTKRATNTNNLASKVTAGATTFVTEFAAAKLALGMETKSMKTKSDPTRGLVVVDHEVAAQTQKTGVEAVQEDKNEAFLSTDDSSKIETIDAPQAASFEAMREESNEQALLHLVESGEITETDQSQSTVVRASAPSIKQTTSGETHIETDVVADVEPRNKATDVYLEGGVDNSRLQQSTETAVNTQLNVAAEADEASQVFVESSETEAAPLAPPKMQSSGGRPVVSPQETLVVTHESQSTPVTSEVSEGSVVYDDAAESVSFEQPNKPQSTLLQTEGTEMTSEGTQPVSPEQVQGFSVDSETESSPETTEVTEQPKKPTTSFFRGNGTKKTPKDAQKAPLPPATSNVVSVVSETKPAPETTEVVEQPKKPTTPFFRDGTKKKSPEGTQQAPRPPATSNVVSVVSETEPSPKTTEVIAQPKQPTTPFLRDGIKETPAVTQKAPLPPATPDVATVVSNAEQSSKTVGTKQKHGSEVNVEPTGATQRPDKANSPEEPPKQITNVQHRKQGIWLPPTAKTDVVTNRMRSRKLAEVSQLYPGKRQDPPGERSEHQPFNLNTTSYSSTF